MCIHDLRKDVTQGHTVHKTPLAINIYQASSAIIMLTVTQEIGIRWLILIS